MTQSLLLSLTGGVLIGTAAGGLYLVSGRIAGISGIFGNALSGPRGGWRGLFILGLVLAGLGARLLGVTPPGIGSPLALTILAGLLVGIGTRLGNGCTSGHGVCGLARLSLRSLTAVLIFMATAIITVFIVRHLMGGVPS
ncbi:MAG: YeeE/YedE thiosulfate transporter family protein [Asticcacaulis sp.]|uniref:YeeE/YedE family protein n=1 Tax=Asticcacaulis sp. TaxID=1872648 RepID=UPI0039E6F680